MFKRWVIRAVFLGLLLMCVAGWAWSGTHLGLIRMGNQGPFVQCATQWGAMMLTWGHESGGLIPDSFYFDPFCQSAERRFWPPAQRPNWDEPRSWYGWSFYLEAHKWGDWYRCISVPYWFVALIVSLALLVLWRRPRPKLDPATAFPVELKSG